MTSRADEDGVLIRKENQSDLIDDTARERESNRARVRCMHGAQTCSVQKKRGTRGRFERRNAFRGKALFTDACRLVAFGLVPVRGVTGVMHP